MPALNSARRSELRAQAHGLAPVVMIGDKGLSESVVAEVERALTAHELIKVKAATNDREARVAYLEELCARLGAQPVQVIGKILVLWRENPGKAAPAKAPAPKAKRKKVPARKSPLERGKQARGSSLQRGKQAQPSSLQRGKQVPAGGVTRSVRPRSPTPSPPRESAPPRRRPRTSR